jgi:DNA-binding NarL/FixJ family response regulator
VITQRGNGRRPDDPIEALVFDPHDATRLGLSVLLQSQPWIRRCLQADNRGDAVELVRRHGPAVALVDVSDSAPFVAPVASALRAAHPELRLVLMSRCPVNARPLVHQARAAGHLAPDASGAEIVGMVRRAAYAAEAPAATTDAVPHAPLTERERQILALLATGATNREIAAQLHLGTDSIKKYATTIYRKLGVRNRTEATHRALELLAHR